MRKASIGIIGGSGLGSLQGLENVEKITIDTPFGKPSAPIVIGDMNGKTIAFLPRHGEGHVILPSEINVRANIWALKSLGVRKLISVSAVGSMKEEIKPRDVVIPDQIFDRTKNRINTMFGSGIVVHIPFAEPFCSKMRALAGEACEALEISHHKKGTYICIDGPQFSTKAESRIYRNWGVDIIGMTAIPEAKLAREAEMCYVTIALSTDYDVWKEGEEVSVEMVLGNMRHNIKNAKKILEYMIEKLDPATDCACHHTLSGAVQTSPEKIDWNRDDIKEKYQIFFPDKY